MANFVFEYAYGRWIDKYSLPVGGDNILVVLVQSSGLPSDGTLAGYQYLSQVWSGGGVEATFTNYTRQSVTTGITITVGATTTVDIANQVWNSAGGATNNTLGALLTCYQPTSISTDSSILLLTKHDFAATTTGGNLTAVISAIGTVT
jgi:hypothetical protein